MATHIIALVVWPKDRQQTARVVTLKPSSLNIITGPTRSGKSAAFSAIDYCLGRKDFGIPEDLLKLAAWFGIILHTSPKPTLIARESRSDQEYQICLRRNDFDKLLAFPRASHTLQDLKTRLLTLLGYEHQFSGRAEGIGSIGARDLLPLYLQAQSLVANPDTFFLGPENNIKKLKLAIVLPEVLLNRLKGSGVNRYNLKRYRDKEREILAIADSLLKEFSDLKLNMVTLCEQAVNLGLISPELRPRDWWTVEKFLSTVELARQRCHEEVSFNLDQLTLNRSPSYPLHTSNEDQTRPNLASTISGEHISITQDEFVRLLTLFKFHGALEEKSKMSYTYKSLDELSERMENLRREQDNLEASGLDERAYLTELEHLAVTLQERISFYATKLRLDYSNYAPIFDFKRLDLTLRDPTTGITVPIRETGGAHNWLGYHLATILSIHEVAINSRAPDFGTFIVLDQLSQAYFPHTDHWTSKDLSAWSGPLAAVYKALDSSISRTGGRLQIIVLDRFFSHELQDTANPPHLEAWDHNASGFLPNEWFSHEN